MKLRRSPQTLLVLSEFLESPQDWKYGYDMSRSTGLKSGTLYPLLMRLAARKLLQTCWENAEAGKPPRHMYKLTATGLKVAREYVRSALQPTLLKPALHGVKSS